MVTPKGILQEIKNRRTVKQNATKEADAIANKWSSNAGNLSTTKVPAVATYSVDPTTLTKEDKQKVHMTRGLRKQVVKTRMDQYKANKK